MFVKNETHLEVTLRKGQVGDDLAVAALIVSAAYKVEGDRLDLLADPPAPLPTDPPDTTLYAVWEGVSVTAAGLAHGPTKPPYLQPVSLRVGETTRRLIVFGDRVWEPQRGGALGPTSPRAFEAISIGFDRAFGGGWDVTPGLMPGTNLPHPGYRQNHPLNPKGAGYYPSVEAARDAPLPNIERPDQLLQRWNDSPDPVGFSACPELVAFRMRDDWLARQNAPNEGLRLPSFKLQHHAPPELFFDDLPESTTITLTGVGAGPMHVAIPRCPASGLVRGTRSHVAIHARLRALHLDANQRVLRVIHDLAFRYDPRRPPRSMRVVNVAGGPQ